MLDGIRRPPIGLSDGKRGVTISNDRNSASTPDLDRLERVVRALAAQGQKLQRENAKLRGQLDERDRRIQTLDDKLLDLNQHRQDALKRLDDLIAQVDQVDARLEASLDPGSE